MERINTLAISLIINEDIALNNLPLYVTRILCAHCYVTQGGKACKVYRLPEKIRIFFFNEAEWLNAETIFEILRTFSFFLIFRANIRN